jgi:hypothetical protein
MSDVFDDTLASAAGSFFLLPGAETVTYYPASGDSRQISAVITRSEPGRMPVVNALVMNSSSEGIASEDVDTGGDKLECAKRVGEKPGLLRITEVLNHDAGLMLFAAS